MPTGQYTAADLQTAPPPQAGQFTAADIDAPPKTLSDYAAQFRDHLTKGLVTAAHPFITASAPNVAVQLWKKVTGQPNTLSDVPPNAVQAFLMSGGFDEGLAEEPGAKPQPQPNEVGKDILSHPAIKPWVQAAKAELMKVPGMNLAKTGLESVRGMMEGAPEAPPAPTPAVPQTNGIPWGSGGQGPLALRGKYIPQETPTMAGITQPQAGEVGSQPSVKPQQLQDAIQEGLGGKPLQRNVSLRDQIQAKAQPATEPKGSTAVEAHKYDAGANELHITPKSNTDVTYVYGDVNSDQAAAFDSGSKGQAWASLRSSGSPLVAKIVDGKRIPVRPVSAPALSIRSAITSSTEPPVGSSPIPQVREDIASVVMNTGKQAAAEVGQTLAKEISNIRYGKPGTILYDFQGKTQSLPEPSDVMLVDADPKLAARYIASKQLPELGKIYKPPASGTSSGDLTGLLRQSLTRARAAKANQ